MFSLFKRKTDLYPWYGKQPILDFIKVHLDEKGNLTPKGEELPDSQEYYSGKSLRWAAGAMDGVFSHHTVGSDQQTKKVNQLLEYLSKQTAKQDNKTRRTTYLELMEESILGIIDDVLDAIRNGAISNVQSLYEEALWFIYNGAHRNVVKFGVSLLGLFHCDQDRELLLTIGKHEEFTLYVAVALQNGTENPNQSLFQLAQHVHGWGKIHLVERLEADSTKITRWLLCHGCENSIMNEYLAYTCATKGELNKMLSEEKIDEELYDGACTILSALIAGGPAENIDDYADAQETLADFVRHSRKMCKSEDHLFTIEDIHMFLEDEDGWIERFHNGWNPEVRSALLEQCREIMERPTWKDVLYRALEKENSTELYKIHRFAKLLKVDIWNYMFSILQTDPLNRSIYNYVMKTDDREKIVQLVQFAERNMPLKQIASGPASELGLGPEFQAHDCLNFILQDLDRFEGVGSLLIHSALQSPVVRNRHMALKTLEGWKKETWEAELKPVLSSLVEDEPEAEVKQRMKALLENVRNNEMA